MKFDSEDNQITISSTRFDKDPSKEDILKRSNGQYLCINKGDKIFECGLLGTFEVPTNPEKEQILKLILVGNQEVGKSNLLFRFCENKYNNKYSETIGIDFRVKRVVSGNQNIKLQIWDTAGSLLLNHLL